MGHIRPPPLQIITQNFFPIFYYFFFHFRCILLQISHKKCFFISISILGRSGVNENYFDNILSSGYIPTITLPTRLSDNSTLIDNTSTSNLSRDIFSCILNNHISDHQPIVLFSNGDLPPTKHKYITIKSNTDEAKAFFVFHLKTNIL